MTTGPSTNPLAKESNGSSTADRTVNIFLIAAEESGDRLGAELMLAIRARAGDRVAFAGVGGRAMETQGLRSLFPIDDLAIIGFGIFRALPLIVGRIRNATAAVITTRPDVLVIIDSPDFTHRVARKVRAANPDIPIVNYISPTFWAWRSGRAKAMRAYIDHVLAVLPFEPQSHAKLGGPACSYVGHPLIERIRDLRPSADDAARRQSDPPVVLILPGSRTTEIRRMLPVFGAAIARLSSRVGTLEVVLPTIPAFATQLRRQTADWPIQPRIVVDPAEKLVAFRTARAALAKSGTVTLELALAGVPTVAAYRVSLLGEIVFRIAVNVPSVILANLIIGENVVPQFLQRDGTPENLANALAPLLSDSPQRRRQVTAFARLDEIMEIGRASPSDRAAQIVLEYATRHKE